MTITVPTVIAVVYWDQANVTALMKGPVIDEKEEARAEVAFCLASELAISGAELQAPGNILFYIFGRQLPE